MNIFYLSPSALECAQWAIDKHVVKMILETAQLLCSAHHLHPYFKLPSKFYKLTHKNHPSAIWTRTGLKNYLWLASHGMELCREYTHRYNKVHATTIVMDWLYNHYPDIKFSVDFTEPPQCMPDTFKVPNNAVEAYRNYYVLDKMVNIDCRWSNRLPPEWI